MRVGGSEVREVRGQRSGSHSFDLQEHLQGNGTQTPCKSAAFSVEFPVTQTFDCRFASSRRFWSEVSKRGAFYTMGPPTKHKITLQPLGELFQSPLPKIRNRKCDPKFEPPIGPEPTHERRHAKSSRTEHPPLLPLLFLRSTLKYRGCLSFLK